jgi:hypothetical protein
MAGLLNCISIELAPISTISSFGETKQPVRDSNTTEQRHQVSSGSDRNHGAATADQPVVGRLPGRSAARLSALAVA